MIAGVATETIVDVDQDHEEAEHSAHRAGHGSFSSAGQTVAWVVFWVTDTQHPAGTIIHDPDSRT